MTFVSLIGLNANERFNYDRYFQIAPLGEDPADAFTRGYFDLAAGMNPKPKTVAMLGADAEFRTTRAGGRAAPGEAAWLQDRVRSRLSAIDGRFQPACTRHEGDESGFCFPGVLSDRYGPESYGSVNEQGLTAGMFGGGMIGPQFAAVRAQLGPLLNGVVGYELYVPEPSIDFPLIKEFLNKYTTRATQEKIDPARLLPAAPTPTPAMQVLEQSVKAGGKSGPGEARATHATRRPSTPPSARSSLPKMANGKRTASSMCNIAGSTVPASTNGANQAALPCCGHSR